MVSRLHQGLRLGCRRCTASVVVLSGDALSPPIECCGLSMIAIGPLPCSVSAPAATPAGVSAGRRYHDDASGLALVCVRSGRGPLSYAGQELAAESAAKEVI